MRAAGLRQRLLLPRAVLHAVSLSSKIPKRLPGQVPGSEVQYGKKVAADDHAASQGMHAMGAGRYVYISDFWKSLNRGKVRLDIGDKPPTEEELEQQRVQARTCLTKRMMMGSNNRLQQDCSGAMHERCVCACARRRTRGSA